MNADEKRLDAITLRYQQKRFRECTPLELDWILDQMDLEGDTLTGPSFAVRFEQYCALHKAARAATIAELERWANGGDG